MQGAVQKPHMSLEVPAERDLLWAGSEEAGQLQSSEKWGRGLRGQTEGRGQEMHPPALRSVLQNKTLSISCNEVSALEGRTSL